MVKPLYIEPRNVDLKMPLVTNARLGNPFLVDETSPKQHHKAVYEIARFMSKECKYDMIYYTQMVLFRNFEPEQDCRSFLWVHPESHGVSNEYRIPCIGAACFRYRRWKNTDPGWAMQWVWMHPYYRGGSSAIDTHNRVKSLLRWSWPTLVEKFGVFFVEPPLTASMKRFLIKNEYWDHCPGLKESLAEKETEKESLCTE